MKKNYKVLAFLSVLLVLIAFIGCAPGGLFGPTLTPLPPTATPTPLPRTLTICLGQEPDSLYLYGTLSAASRLVLQAIYDGPFDHQGSEVTPVLLQKMPSLANGDILLNPVDVIAGDEVVNADGNLVTLASGVEVFPAGCSSQDCIIAWDGTSPLQVNQMSVTYQMKAGLKWSDGQALTSTDSIFSFKITADPDTPWTKEQVDLTESYTAVDETTLTWLGKPGYLTPSVELFFWSPLPVHILADLDATQLLSDGRAVRAPLGWGAYQIQAWQTGEVIHLSRNPNYAGIGAGLPKFEFLDFRFLQTGQDPLAAVQNGTCDLVDEFVVSGDLYTDLHAASQGDQMQVWNSPGDSWEVLAFGIKPVSHDDGYYPYGTDRADIFGDGRVRQAITACIDRQAIIDELLAGLSDVPFGFLPATHPDVLADAPVITFDVARANELLTAAGWQDYDNNPTTPRVAVTATNVPYGAQLEIGYVTSDTDLHQEIARRVVASLAQCGIKVNVTTYPQEELYQPSPDGLIFGRKFDLAQLTWQVNDHTGCDLFNSVEIPTQLNYWVGVKTGGANFTGYSNAALDATCKAIDRAGMDADGLRAGKLSITTLLNADLPVIPLFFLPRIQLARADLCGAQVDPLTGLAWEGLENWDVGNNCQAN